MAYKIIGKSAIIDNTGLEVSSDEITVLSDNTANTWQRDRSEEEKKADTSFGKLAEQAVMKLFEEDNFTKYTSYDDIRTDDLKISAPFDFILGGEISDELKDEICKECKKYKNIYEKVRNKLRNNNLICVEIKSTRLTLKQKTACGFTSYDEEEDLNKLNDYLQNMDFFTYPRKGNKGDFTFEEYCEKVKNEEKFLPDKYKNMNSNDPEFINYVIDKEIANASDITIRVFVDEEEKKSIILGWMYIKDILEKKTLKKFPSQKSQDAIYFVSEISNGYYIKEIYKLLKS